MPLKPASVFFPFPVKLRRFAKLLVTRVFRILWVTEEWFVPPIVRSFLIYKCISMLIEYLTNVSNLLFCMRFKNTVPIFSELVRPSMFHVDLKILLLSSQEELAGPQYYCRRSLCLQFSEEALHYHCRS